MHTPDGMIMAEDGSTNDVTIMPSLVVYTLTNDVLGNVTYLIPYLKHPLPSKLCSKDKYNGWVVCIQFISGFQFTFFSKEIH